MLGENTYQGPTISEFGNMHIVRGVGGDVYAKAGNVQINGYAKNVYALPDAEVSISDTVNTNGYTGPDVDFVKAVADSDCFEVQGAIKKASKIGKNIKLHFLNKTRLILMADCLLWAMIPLLIPVR